MGFRRREHSDDLVPLSAYRKRIQGAPLFLLHERKAPEHALRFLPGSENTLHLLDIALHLFQFP